MTKFKTFDDLSKIRSIEDCAEAAEEIENMVKHMVAEDFNQIILDRFTNPKVHRPLMKVLVCRDMVHLFFMIFQAGKMSGKLEMIADTYENIDIDEPDQYNRQVH
jgi:hypothetical protein|tara:strand:- start:218 stop:532 length:315 start_codon:yes stop_codon:yes gene_type:complete